MTRFPKRVMLAALAVLIGGGCAAIARVAFARPTVEVTSVEITGIGFTGGSLALITEVYNPNSFDIHTTRLEAAVYLEDTHFGDVALNRAVRLDAHGTTLIRVPVSFTWQGVGAGARALLGRGAVSYSLTGRLFLDTPGGQQTVEVRTGGDVGLRNLVP